MIINPKKMREYILMMSSTLSSNEKSFHTIYGLEPPRKRKRDKTFRYARKHRLSRVQMWDLAIKLLKSKNIKYYPKITQDKEDPFHPNVILYAYVYYKKPMYIKYYIDKRNVTLRSLHPTKSNKGFKMLKG